MAGFNGFLGRREPDAFMHAGADMVEKAEAMGELGGEPRMNVAGVVYKFNNFSIGKGTLEFVKASAAEQNAIRAYIQNLEGKELSHELGRIVSKLKQISGM